jgi:hypothetical protein
MYRNSATGICRICCTLWRNSVILCAMNTSPRVGPGVFKTAHQVCIIRKLQAWDRFHPAVSGNDQDY